MPTKTDRPGVIGGGGAGPRAFDGEHRGMTVGLLALVTMFAFEAVAVSLVMPSVVRDLHGVTLYPVAVIGMLTAAIPGMVLGGRWGDARGARGPVLGGGALFVAGLVVSTVAGTMSVFVAGRLLQGVGSGIALTAMYVAVADAYPAALRRRVFALFATAWVAPSVVGPFVAGALVDALGWRSVFAVVAAFAAVSTLAVVRRMRRPVRRAAAPRDSRLLYAVVAAAGAVGLHLGGQGSAAQAVLLVPLGLVVCVVAIRQLLPAGTLTARPGLPAVVAARGVFGGAFALLETFLPLVLQSRSGLSPTATGLVMMAAALGWTAGSWRAGRSTRPAGTIFRLGSVSVIVGAAAALVVVPLQSVTPLATAVAIVGVTFAGAGMGLVTPLLSTLALDLAPEGRQGESGGAIQISDALGQSVAAGVVGAVFGHWVLTAAATAPLAGFGGAALLALLTWVVARRCTRPQNGGDGVG